MKTKRVFIAIGLLYALAFGFAAAILFAPKPEPTDELCQTMLCIRVFDSNDPTGTAPTNFFPLPQWAVPIAEVGAAMLPIECRKLDPDVAGPNPKYVSDGS